MLRFTFIDVNKMIIIKVIIIAKMVIIRLIDDERQEI